MSDSPQHIYNAGRLTQRSLILRGENFPKISNNSAKS